MAAAARTDGRATEAQRGFMARRQTAPVQSNHSPPASLTSEWQTATEPGSVETVGSPSQTSDRLAPLTRARAAAGKTPGR